MTVTMKHEQHITPEQICFVGVGGAGGLMIDTLAASWPVGPVLAAVNTDEQALSRLSVPVKIAIGDVETHGLGAAGDHQTGQLAAQAATAVFQELFQNRKMVVLLAGLGGGTGSGAAPVIADVAHKSGALVLMLATMPFAFEGTAVTTKAVQAVESLKTKADAILLVPNQRLFAALGDCPQAEAFSRANTIIADGLTGLSRMILHTGFMGVTFADLRTVIRQSNGFLTFAGAATEGPDRALRAAEAVIKHPLMDQGERLAKAQAVLVSIAGSDITFMELETIMGQVAAAASKETTIRMGPAPDPDAGGVLRLTLLIPEHWQTEAEPAMTSPATETRPAPEHRSMPPAKATRPKGTGRPVQEPLPIGGSGSASGKGRFKDVESTIFKGENLDLPTYQRRSIPLVRR